MKCPLSGRGGYLHAGKCGDVSEGDAATVGEGGDEERIDKGTLLALVEDLRNAFIGEGDSSNLDADHLLLLCPFSRKTHA